MSMQISCNMYKKMIPAANCIEESDNCKTTERVNLRGAQSEMGVDRRLHLLFSSPKTFHKLFITQMSQKRVQQRSLLHLRLRTCFSLYLMNLDMFEFTVVTTAILSFSCFLCWATCKTTTNVKINMQRSSLL